MKTFAAGESAPADASSGPLQRPVPVAAVVCVEHGEGAGAAPTGSGEANHPRESPQPTFGSALGAVSAIEQARFIARHRQCVRNARGPLAVLYGESVADQVLDALSIRAAAAFAARPDDLRLIDAEREVDPGWFQRSDRLGYVAYCEQFGPQLSDVQAHVPYLAELGVTYFHLMNVLRPRPEPNDGGFAVQDYRDVDARYGTIGDLRALAERLRADGISLCLDVVMNHTAREHPWAQAALAGDPEKRSYYRFYDDRTEPDRWEQTLPEVFPEIAPGNFTWVPEIESWVWTTFNDYQWDLNYANPAVLVEMLDVMLFLANLGVEALRLDAVAFTWKRVGTNCQNQPEAHLIAQLLRMFTNLAAPGVLVKAEAIVGPRDLLAYLGEYGAEGERNECQLAYHNQLMVLIWSALASRNARLLAAAMRNLPRTPKHAGWATYVRCHDDIGWAIDDGDAGSVGTDAAAHRRFLAAFYRGDFPGSFARGAAFSSNPETGDERTCGSTASLAGLESALARDDQRASDVAIRRIALAYGLAASFGMPLLYMGDEFGALNDASFLDHPSRCDDSRWMHRPSMDWAAAKRAGQPGTMEHRVRSAIVHVLRVRAATPALSQGGDHWVIDVDDPSVFAFGRYHPREGRLLGLANMSDAEVSVDPSVFAAAGLEEGAVEVLDSPGVGVWDGRLHLPPLTLAWYTDGLADRVVPSR